MNTPAKTIRVLLADDHPVVRNGIQKMLARDPEIEVVGQACRGEEAIELVEKLSPDVLLLDMEMPGMNGVLVTQQVRRRFPATYVLALSGYDDRAYVMETLQNGASGYLIKDEDIETIVAAVKGVARGETGWLSRRISALITAWMRREDPTSQSLTQRELEVLRLVVAGRTNQRIDVELHISEKTIEKYLESILRKLGVNSRVEAAVYAVRNNLISKLSE